MSYLFIDNLGFKRSAMSVKKIAQVLKKVNNLIIKQEKRNVVTYNKVKIELVLFFWAR